MTHATAPRGLGLHVLRAAHADCTNNGISARFDRLILVGTCDRDTTETAPLPKGSRVVTADPRTDAPALLRRFPFTLGRDVHTGLHLVPAVPIHDRVE